jgi:hypothetical protein
MEFAQSLKKKKMAELGLKPASSNIKIGLFSVD